jgi:hypothetical protein
VTGVSIKLHGTPTLPPAFSVFHKGKTDRARMGPRKDAPARSRTFQNADRAQNRASCVAAGRAVGGWGSEIFLALRNIGGSGLL